VTDPTASVGAEQTPEPGSAAPVDETPPKATIENAKRSDPAAATGNGGPTNGAAAPAVEGSPPPDEVTGLGADAADAADAASPATPAAATPAAPALGAPVGVVSAGGGAPPREEVPWLIIWAAIGVVLAAGAAIELILALKTIIELLVIAGFLAVVLSPAVGLLVRLKLRRGLATTVVFLLGMCAFGGLGYLFIHPLYREAIRFADDLPATLARVQAGKGRIGSLIARYHLQKDAATYIPKIRNYLSHLGGPALSIARTVLSGLGGLVLMSIMTFLMLLEGPSVVRGVLRVLPAPQGRRVRRILDDIAKSVTGYVIGNFATSVIAGVICGAALAVLGVPFAVVFGVWVALVDLIPLVGGLLAGVPTVAFAFLYSPTAGIITLIVFLIYQQVENHLLNPLIMSRTVHLNPLWVLLSVLAGAELAGFIGALLAIPAAGTIHVIARDIWDERRGHLKTTPTVGPEHQPLA
jgi:predicted PurR-regulated permease PerM